MSNGRRWRAWAALGALWLWSVAAGADFRERLPQDEVIYFLLPDRFDNGDAANDRGGLKGDRLKTGFDPTDARFYHGGDLKGVLRRLDYIQQLGATALWLGPIFKNKPVQGAPGHETAGYHGYWITDFTRIDPHFGTEEDFRQLVAAVHSRGMKLYMDIVINHTADVIAYRECPTEECPYRPRTEPPYTPYVPKGEEHVKVPDWLNDPIYYHNRGNSTFEGESAVYGDFFWLDDIMTENPRVLQGFIDIYAGWIERCGIDGLRIDTAKHVNPEFWQTFVPAMLSRAHARGIANFTIFGEVYTGTEDVALLARHTRVDKLPAVLDYAFTAAMRDTVAGSQGTEVLARLFEDDPLYEGGERAALQLPTFVSNHDQGRFAYFVRSARHDIGDDEVAKRVLLAHAMIMTLRGVPVLYSGDEQGFAGVGGDNAARQDMFGHFDANHPLYRAFAGMARLRASQPALQRGRQIVRGYAAAPGLFAASRIDPVSGRELLIAFNTSTAPVTAKVEVNADSRHFTSLHGQCAAEAFASGVYRVVLAPLDYVVCAAGDGG